MPTNAKRKKKQTCINITVEAFNWLKQQAADDDRSTSWIVERLIAAEKRRVENKFKRAAADGPTRKTSAATDTAARRSTPRKPPCKGGNPAAGKGAQ